MFKRQLNDYTCSPVLLYNIGVWMGELIDLSSMIYQCKTTIDGTDDENFEAVLYRLWPSLSIKKDADINIVEFLSKPNTAIALAHRETWEEDYGEEHHSFWLSPNLAINLKENELYTKNEHIIDVIDDTDLFTDSVVTIYFLEKKCN